TGRGRYVSDVEVPRMLHAAFVRSAHAHAGLRTIDVAAAAAHPGILGILTGKDAPFAGVGIRARSALPGYVETEQPILAWPIVRHAGEALAVVVGVERYDVEDAAALVRVDYEPRPASVDLLGATRDGAPPVHEALRGNAFLVRRFQQGDVEAALASAATV